MTDTWPPPFLNLYFVAGTLSILWQSMFCVQIQVLFKSYHIWSMQYLFFLFLAYFIQHDVLQFHTFYTNGRISSFCSWKAFLCVCVCIKFFIYSSDAWYHNWFHILAIVKTTTTNMDFIYFECINSSEIAGSYSSSLSQFFNSFISSTLHKPSRFKKTWELDRQVSHGSATWASTKSTQEVGLCWWQVSPQDLLWEMLSRLI